jgi:hypothetical protein
MQLLMIAKTRLNDVIRVIQVAVPILRLPRAPRESYPEQRRANKRGQEPSLLNLLLPLQLVQAPTSITRNQVPHHPVDPVVALPLPFLTEVSPLVPHHTYMNDSKCHRIGTAAGSKSKAEDDDIWSQAIQGPNVPEEVKAIVRTGRHAWSRGIAQKTSATATPAMRR